MDIETFFDELLELGYDEGFKSAMGGPTLPTVELYDDERRVRLSIARERVRRSPRGGAVLELVGSARRWSSARRAMDRSARLKAMELDAAIAKLEAVP